MDKQELLDFLCNRIENIKTDKPILVAIDGVDASGKTTLSKELGKALKERSNAVINASIDGFHNPREERYRMGSKSPEGYYRCSFDYDSLVGSLLKPLKESGRYKTAVYDFKTETAVHQDYKAADKNSILIIEGVFLLRPELYSYWDYKIFLHIDFEEVIKRTKIRDQYLFGSEEEIEKRYRSKYIPGQQIYLRESDPHSRCDLVINNKDFNNPHIVKSTDKIQELRDKAINFA